jgi:putative Ca2+/H+ antiporter (TMEM165/GDT1 family)
MGPVALSGFLVVLVVVGGLELFDRTSFALIALSARARAGPTWAGGAVAFVLSTGIAVTVGAAVVAALGPQHLAWVRVGGGVFLVAYAVWMALRPAEVEDARRSPDVRSAFMTAFVTIFLLEIGDTTMIFQIVFVANYGWWVVFGAGVLGLVAVAAWDVLLGQRLGARLSPERLKLVVVVVLLIVGALTILYGLAPALFPVLSVSTGA